ncbi:unnamed protein product [Mycena citricolor]|uniref:Uncharacterized protein n=1 Tax=Mycena citricolor TaxID=2018698 RepID=A0AAD2H6F9_9AGAR|nr:unnamed protein product [Mycena citricolor]
MGRWRTRSDLDLRQRRDERRVNVALGGGLGYISVIPVWIRSGLHMTATASNSLYTDASVTWG